MSAPPAPWRSVVDAALWWQPGGGVGGLAAYRAGPVGPYLELLRALPTWRGAHVVLMAVDSPASVEGGRRNWALPKELARFEADPDRPGRVTVAGDGWAVRVAIRARPRAVPFASVVPCAQEGAFLVAMWGRARLASVTVDGARRPALLVSGRQVVTRRARSSPRRTPCRSG